MTLVGVILLTCGLPLTLWLCVAALSPTSGISPWLPPLAGGPPILLGYGACAYAARRLAQAKQMEQNKPPASRSRRAAPIN